MHNKKRSKESTGLIKTCSIESSHENKQKFPKLDVDPCPERIAKYRSNQENPSIKDTPSRTKSHHIENGYYDQ